ncbi:MAG: DUF3473 domain-containing protein [Bacteroidales bacterium]|jgi:polysaccharide deacetylase family protein (PEP-CTERM system associated)|nr:DUF3473 domain-containing protein [Bacteroidales bacterium]
MKILVISEVFYPEIFIINDLVLEWSKAGHSVEVLTRQPSYPVGKVFSGYKNAVYGFDNWHDVRIHRIMTLEGYNKSKILKFLNYIIFIQQGIRCIKNILISNKFDLIFVSQTGPLTVAIPALVVAKKYKLKVAIWTFDIWPDVVWTYGIPNNLFTRFIFNNIVRRIYGKCDMILVASEMFKDKINNILSLNRSITYAPNWLMDKDNYSESLIEFDSNKINFTFTGNISLFQNLHNVIIGFHKAKISNAALHIIGDGSKLSELKQYVVDNGVENVKFWGRVPSNEIHDILSKSDISVLSLIKGGMVENTEPLKLQSYLHAGKPIFCVGSGICKKIIEKNKLGIATDAEDIEQIADGFSSMIEFISIKERLETVKQNALTLINTRFHKETIIKHINNVCFSSFMTDIEQIIPLDYSNIDNTEDTAIIPDKKQYILSFDIEDWFHLLDDNVINFHDKWDKMEVRIYKNMELIFESLKKYSVDATFFIIGWTCDKHPDIVKTIAKRFEIGSHSMHHKLVYTMTPQEFKMDLLDSIHRIEDLIGKKVKHYRAPGLSIHNEQKWAFEIMAEAGIEMDSSLTNVKFASYGYYNGIPQEPFILEHNGIEIKEFPIVSKYPLLFSAGGYFRLLNYKFIKYMTKHSDYVMTYFHPRDFDAEQPMLKDISLMRKFKSYYGLSEAQKKLEKWMYDFRFINISMANEKIDWSKAPKIQV